MTSGSLGAKVTSGSGDSIRGGRGGALDITKHAKPVDNETPAQKQAAAKMALRKQLEKTLLQVKAIARLVFSDALKLMYCLFN